MHQPPTVAVAEPDLFTAGPFRRESNALSIGRKCRSRVLARGGDQAFGFGERAGDATVIQTGPGITVDVGIDVLLGIDQAVSFPGYVRIKGALQADQHAFRDAARRGNAPQALAAAVIAGKHDIAAVSGPGDAKNGPPVESDLPGGTAPGGHNEHFPRGHGEGANECDALTIR